MADWDSPPSWARAVTTSERPGPRSGYGRDWFGEAVAVKRRLGPDSTQRAVADGMEPPTDPASLRHGLARQGRAWREVEATAART